MQTFGRLLSVLTFLLSLGFIAQALPTASNGGLAVRQYNSPESYSPSNGGYTKPNSGNGSGDVSGSPSVVVKVDVLAMVHDLNAKIDTELAVLGKAAVVADVEASVKVIVGHVKACAAALVNVKVDVDAEVKAKIAAVIVAIISAIVKVCAAVSVKVGVQACLALWAQIDVALHLLILTLNGCVSGLLQIVIKLCLNLDAEIIAALKVVKLDLCVKILVIAKVFVGVY